MANYTDITAVENYTLKDISAAFETQVTEWISGVSLMLDQMANRKLVADAADSDHYYDGNYKPQLMVDDFVTIETVAVGDEWGGNFSAITDFVKYPAAAPHWMLVRKNNYFERGVQNVKVTGRQGYFASLPDDLKFAATVIVAGVIHSQRPGPQNKKAESIGNYSVTYTDDKGVADYQQALAIVQRHHRYVL